MNKYSGAFILNPLPEADCTTLYQSDHLSCPVEATLGAIGGRWKVLILHELFNGTRRFGELHRSLHGITQKMLTQQLQEAECGLKASNFESALRSKTFNCSIGTLMLNLRSSASERFTTLVQLIAHKSASKCHKLYGT